MTIIIEHFNLGHWWRRDGGEPFRDREDAQRFIERLRAYDRLGDYRIIEKDEAEDVPRQHWCDAAANTRPKTCGGPQ